MYRVCYYVLYYFCGMLRELFDPWVNATQPTRQTGEVI
jgi:hypothetical protein